MIKEKEEVWKEVPNYENYMVSNRGRVKSLNFNRTGVERLLKQNIVKEYLVTTLFKEGRAKPFYTHQLVAMVFLNHIPCGHRLVVDHIDGNRLNNNLSNLQVITNRENTSKDQRGGSSQYVGVCWSKQSEKWKVQIRIEGKQKHLGYFEDEVSASEAYQKALTEAEK